jgi:hypothetical protein
MTETFRLLNFKIPHTLLNPAAQAIISSLNIREKNELGLKTWMLTYSFFTTVIKCFFQNVYLLLFNEMIVLRTDIESVIVISV